MVWNQFTSGQAGPDNVLTMVLLQFAFFQDKLVSSITKEDFEPPTSAEDEVICNPIIIIILQKYILNKNRMSLIKIKVKSVYFSHR